MCICLSKASLEILITDTGILILFFVLIQKRKIFFFSFLHRQDIFFSFLHNHFV